MFAPTLTTPVCYCSAMRHPALSLLSLTLACSFDGNGLSGGPGLMSLSESATGAESGEAEAGSSGTNASETQATSSTSGGDGQTSEISSASPSGTTGSSAESDGTGPDVGTETGTGTESSTSDADSSSDGGESSTGSFECVTNIDCPLTDVCFQRSCYDARAVIYKTNATGFGTCSNDQVTYTLFLDNAFVMESGWDFCPTEWDDEFMLPGPSTMRLMVNSLMNEFWARICWVDPMGNPNFNSCEAVAVEALHAGGYSGKLPAASGHDITFTFTPAALCSEMVGVCP